ncbi:MAG TPA: acyltransferase [Devosia sp.]|nr:acyltransferase [Devosia sp.]
MIDLKREQSDFIQIARGIAIFIVAYYHYTTRIPYDVLGSSVAPALPEHIGKLGVHIFFVISGFLISKTLDRSQSIAGFYARRISRLWPLYAFACVFVFLFVNIFPPPVVLSGPKQFYDVHPTVLDLLSNLVFLNDTTVSVDGAYWSVVVEVKFYFWLAVFAALFRRDFVRVFAWTAIALSAIDFAITGFAPDAMQAAGPLHVLSRALHGVFLSQYLPFFALGAVLQRGERYQFLAPLAMLAAFSAIAVVAEDHEFVAMQDMRFLLILGLLLAADRLLLAGRVFIWIGDYSYALYLFHQMIGLTVMKMLTPYIGIDPAIGGAIVVVTLIAFASSKALEWRFRKQFTGAFEWLFGLIGLDRIRLDTSDRIPEEPSGEASEATAPAGLKRV